MIDPVEYRKALAELRIGILDDSSVEGVLEELKLKGFSQVDCIRAVVELGLCRQSDAKRTVHYSAAWNSTRERSEKLHAEAEAAFLSFLDRMNSLQGGASTIASEGGTAQGRAGRFTDYVAGVIPEGADHLAATELLDRMDTQDGPTTVQNYLTHHRATGNSTAS